MHCQRTAARVVHDQEAGDGRAGDDEGSRAPRVAKRTMRLLLMADIVDIEGRGQGGGGGWGDEWRRGGGGGWLVLCGFLAMILGDVGGGLRRAEGRECLLSLQRKASVLRDV